MDASTSAARRVNRCLQSIAVMFLQMIQNFSANVPAGRPSVQILLLDLPCMSRLQHAVSLLFVRFALQPHNLLEKHLQQH